MNAEVTQAANTNTIVVFLLILLALVLVVLIFRLRFHNKKPQTIITPTSSTHTTPAATPAAAATAPAADKKWHSSAWGVVTIFVIALALGALLTFFFSGQLLNLGSGLAGSAGNLNDLSHLMVVASVIAAILCFAGILLFFLGKKGGGVAILAGFLIYVGALGAYSDKDARQQLLAAGNTRVLSVPNCAEKTLIVAARSSNTFYHNEACSNRLVMRWETRQDAFMHVVVNGSLGLAEYTKYPGVQPKFSYRGAIRSVTFENKASIPTEVAFFYQ